MECDTGKVCYQQACCDKTTNCLGRECGDDGCGDVCGTCGSGLVCSEGQCVDPEACDDGNSVDWDGCTDGEISEFRANGTTSDDQSFPAVATFSGGGFAVVWQSKDQDGDDNGIFAQMYDSDGQAAGSEFQVNSTTSDKQEHPDVAALDGGGAVVVWQSNGQDGDSFGIFARRFNENGTPAGSEIAVNSYTTADQLRPDVCPLSNGDYVVSWDGKGSGDNKGVFLRQFESDGTPATAQARANTYTGNQQDNPDVFVRSGDNSVVVWASKNQDGQGWGVYGQRYGEGAVKQGAEFKANSTTSSDQWFPAGGPLDSGGFVTVWHGNGSGDAKGIFAQRFQSNGDADGAEFRLNATTSNEQSLACVAHLGGDKFVAAWQSDKQDGDGMGVIGRRFDGGAPASAEFQVNLYTKDAQERPDCAPLAGGAYILVWQSKVQDGDGYGIYVQRYDSDGTRKYH